MIYILNLNDLIVYVLKIFLVRKIVAQKILDDALKRVYCEPKTFSCIFCFFFYCYN